MADPHPLAPYSLYFTRPDILFETVTVFDFTSFHPFLSCSGIQGPKEPDVEPGAMGQAGRPGDQATGGPPVPQVSATSRCPAICKKVCVGFCPSLNCCTNSRIPLVEAQTGGRQQILPISVEVQEDS